VAASDKVTPIAALPAAGSRERPVSRRRTVSEEVRYEDDEPLSQDAVRLSRLFERLGGNGKVKIFRVINGTPQYSATQSITEDFASNLEERIAGLCGGGEYILKGFVDSGKKCVGEAQVHVDERVFPAKQTAREAERQGGQAGAPYDHAKQLEAQERMHRLQLEQQREMAEREGNWMRAFMAEQKAAAERAMLMQQTFMQSQMDLTVRLIAAQHGNTAAVTGTSEFDRMKQYQDFFQKLGFGPAGQQSETRTLGERIIAAPLERLADRVGDKAMDYFFPKPEPAAPQLAAAKPAAPAAPAPAATPPPAAPAAAPAKETPPAREAKPFVRSELLTPEQFRARRDAARTKQANTQPPAPPAKDVVGGQK